MSTRYGSNYYREHIADIAIAAQAEAYAKQPLPDVAAMTPPAKVSRPNRGCHRNSNTNPTNAEPAANLNLTLQNAFRNNQPTLPLLPPPAESCVLPVSEDQWDEIIKCFGLNKSDKQIILDNLGRINEARKQKPHLQVYEYQIILDNDRPIPIARTNYYTYLSDVASWIATDIAEAHNTNQPIINWAISPVQDQDEQPAPPADNPPLHANGEGPGEGLNVSQPTLFPETELNAFHTDTIAWHAVALVTAALNGDQKGINRALADIGESMQSATKGHTHTRNVYTRAIIADLFCYEWQQTIQEVA